MYTDDNFMVVNKLLNGSQLSKLHTFEIAARHCSFVLAADELAITASAVSHRISSLEQELGFKLFQRFHRKIELTCEGKRLFWTIKSTLEHLNQEILEIKNQELSGNLTIYSRPTFTQCWLVPKLADFNQLYPSINLNILVGNENVNFRGYGIDLAIYFDDIISNELSHQYLMSEYITPVCSPQYAKKHNLMGNIDNLQYCTLLHDKQAWSYDSDTKEWNTWAEHFNITLEPSHKCIVFDRSDLAAVAAIHHAGVAMGRKNMIWEKIENNELVAPFPNTEVLCKQYYYTCTLPQQQNEKVNAFIQWLKSTIDE
ncbi:DNA-binding transcriptional regulator DsdC [Photorhabdus sp. P32]|uniref:DNA-binding transcriptional regulator DsdC n=1 Tax=Photorhabdus TaxID=29487 RepID=UPI00223CA7BD|nr:DNA-binding transcriptional regulator DsdC [Photorhabdus aballayi]MCW7548945.1 DNA-binding transcriptional regulator DsdC [Photorhabdus aballayi]